MSKKVYKLVRVVGKKRYSAVLKDLESERCFWHNSNQGIFVLEYKKGRKTKPPEEYPMAKIMAFSTYERALNFLEMYIGHKDDDYKYFEIWEAKTSDVEIPPYSAVLVGSLAGEGSLIEYWSMKGTLSSSQRRALETTEFPGGTVLCKDITLVKRLEVEPSYA